MHWRNLDYERRIVYLLLIQRQHPPGHEIADAVGAEIVAIDDGADRNGWRGRLRAGKDAMRRTTAPLKPFTTQRNIEDYKLVIVGTPVWGGRCSSPIRGLLKRRGLEMSRVGYVLTRSSNRRCESVYDQMDLYTAEKHILEVSLQPGSVGYTFWRDKFISDVQKYLETGHVG